MIDGSNKVVIEVINDTDEVVDAIMFAPFQYASQTNDDGDLILSGVKIKSGMEGKTYFDILMDFNLSLLEPVFSDVIYMELIKGREEILENDLGVYLSISDDEMEYYELEFNVEPYQVPKQVSSIKKPIRFDMNTELNYISYPNTHIRFTIFFNC
jgi:hypothetical protein